MRTKENIHRHELIGLNAKVVDSRVKANVGIKGIIIDETQKSLIIRDDKQKRVMKDAVKLELTLPNKSKVELDGKKILGRPWERVKNG